MWKAKRRISIWCFSVDEIGQVHRRQFRADAQFADRCGGTGFQSCQGKVWVIVTSQEDIDSVTHVKGNDFSKIQGRFNTRLSLSSASVDEVISGAFWRQNRRCRDAASADLSAELPPSCATCSPSPPGTHRGLEGLRREDEFVEAYPFVPYQFKLAAGSAGAGAQSTAPPASTFPAANAACFPPFRRLRRDAELRRKLPCVPFYRLLRHRTHFSGRRHPPGDRPGGPRRAQAGDGLKARGRGCSEAAVPNPLCGRHALRNLENLSTLMISDIHADKITLAPCPAGIAGPAGP